MTTAAELLAQAQALLIDFDGPICSIFAGIPAHVVADQLRTVLADGGHTNLPAEVATTKDPFDVFRYAATLGENEARYVEAAFTAHEVEAIPTATPTPGAHELIQSWHESRRPLAIVSNNSTSAIGIYLELYNLRSFVDVVLARTGADTSQLKPSPHLLHHAVVALAVSPAGCAFIGDSLTDIEAAHAAGVPSIGYANKPGKQARLAAGGADALTEALTGLMAVS
ncbi:HAD-IA family hydrolase [Amycolatopsis rhizosphaerae]|uniref:HAD-IA family hydrolase n=1 Tax=Amycolatopsis rhizosphaerae TaxID=2053003 RepID=A0A558BIP5_9PSEU|nr:HAD-IA family hydrolase [Amycolatopsis rhizosphaerae]TVT36399.1 HAD-IA family hydrolase [Amycolatopsis rhizosphaerae]